MKRPQHGFSLLELAVALAVVGVSGLLLWQLLPRSRELAEGQPESLRLERVRLAVEGYALAHSRLPCPASDGAAGSEDCAPGAGSPATVAAAGWLPWRSLGLAQGDGALKYGVYRVAGTDLSSASNRAYTPYLPPSRAGGYTLDSSGMAATSNGLDLCLSLRQAAATPSASAAGGVAAGGVPVAFVLAAPGANHRFDGLNATASAAAPAFALPGRSGSATDDDPMLAVGLGELSARLSCPARLAAVNGEARSAYQAYDQWLNMTTFKDFRAFAYRVRKSDTQFAAFNLTLATVRLGVAIANQLSAISLAANSAGVGAGTVIGAIAAIGGATASVAGSTYSLASAVIAEIKAGKQSQGAAGLYTQSGLALDAALLKAYQDDQKGLLP